MASLVLRRTRSLVVILGLCAGALVVPTLAAAEPAKPAKPAKPTSQPTISSVERQLGKLSMESSQLVETYNQARITEAQRAKAAETAARASVLATARYTESRRQFVRMIQAQYESTSMGAAGALLDSRSDTNYLDRLSTLDLVSNQTAATVGQVKDAKEQAQSAERRAQQLFADARKQRSEVGARRVEVTKQIGRYKALLDKLNAAQRAKLAKLHGAITNRNGIAIDDGKKATTQSAITISLTGSSKQAQAAVRFALAQVGKPYVFGSAGPGTFDCSGLTMAAWHKGGVSLPHSARGQYGYGHHVSRNDLQPGDLLFFYQPIGHVTIYIGDGLMVSAPTEGEPVQVVTVASFNSDYTGATRLT